MSVTEKKLISFPSGDAPATPAIGKSCEKCGGQLAENWIACPYCGARVANGKKRKQRTGNGTGHVFKRGRTYTLRMRTIVYSETPDGKPKQGYKDYTKGGFPTKRAAYEYRDTLKGAKADKGKMSLSSYWRIFERDKLPKLSRTKQTNYKTAYRRLESIQFREVSTLSVADLQDVISNAHVGYYPAHDMKTVLNKLFAMAAADGNASKDLPSFIELPDLDESEQIPFTLEEVNSIAELWEKGNLFSGYILLMIYSSMMPGELLQLRKGMIDFDNQRIVGAGIKTKQRKTQAIVFPAYITPILKKLVDSSDSDLLLEGYYYGKFAKEFKATIAFAGCRPLTPYSCRHTTASVLALDPNVAPALISRIMRHSARMTERYTHVDDTSAIEAVNRMKSILPT